MDARIDQILSRCGFCPRSQASHWVKKGRVTVDGIPAKNTSQRADPASVLVDGDPLPFPHRLLVAFHKPVDVVCSHTSEEGTTIYQLLPEQWGRRKPQPDTIGRLDKDTSGLIFLTDDGPLLHRMASPKHAVEKVYEAELDSDPSPDLIPLFASGTLVLRNETTPCRPAKLEILGNRQARLTITEGRYHQVRRMFASQGLTVVKLHRSRIGTVELGDLPVGQWREISLD